MAAHISACAQDGNEIPTAMPMFSVPGNMSELSKTMSDVWMFETSKMAAKIQNYF